MILAGTGHRPHKLGGYSPKIQTDLRFFAYHYLDTLKPHRVISGMAQGWDQALAAAAIALSIPLDAYIPCPGQESPWPAAAQAEYQRLLAQASSVRVVSPRYSPSAMHARDRAMVDACTDLLALWDGSPESGTGRTIAYARTRPVTILNVWSKWQTFSR